MGGCLARGYPTVRAVREALEQVQREYTVKRTTALSETVNWLAAVQKLEQNKLDFYRDSALRRRSGALGFEELASHRALL